MSSSRLDVDSSRPTTQFTAGDASPYAQLLDDACRRVFELERGNTHLGAAHDRAVERAIAHPIVKEPR